MFSLDEFHRTYETVVTPVTINSRALKIHTPKSIDRFFDSRGSTANFPLWAKIWEASTVLADYLARQPAHAHETLLEVGCGLGLVGIVAAKSGYRVTMTEIDPHALNFARANALINGCPEIVVERLDWNTPGLTGRFDMIVGSETVYKPEHIDSLETLFDRYLDPKGTIILSTEMRSTNDYFWRRMEPRYHIQARKLTLRSDQGKMHIALFRLRLKDHH
ncbi:methyltransferase [uncultured Desulfosarcina sp.]|uniref:class I SAM-dependent methyltransferase n=1 Tax=uncultured Desulfosarcina sp. TaxID=218289 RepID=UPI0029C8477C|nr:methyltransferase [uncultured Desulfosarcina sp.]